MVRMRSPVRSRQLAYHLILLWQDFFLFQKYLDMKVFCDRIDNGNRNEHGYDTLQKDKAFLDAEASSSAFLFCCVSLTPLYLNEIEHGYDTLQKDKVFLDARASSSAFLFCCVSHTPLYLNEIEHGL